MAGSGERAAFLSDVFISDSYTIPNTPTYALLATSGTGLLIDGNKIPNVRVIPPAGVSENIINTPTYGTDVGKTLAGQSTPATWTLEFNADRGSAAAKKYQDIAANTEVVVGINVPDGTNATAYVASGSTSATTTSFDHGDYVRVSLPIAISGSWVAYDKA